MEKIKKYWKEILICLLVLFSLNKCTQSCSRGTVVDQQKIEIQQKDSIIKSKTDSLNILTIRWSDAQNNQETYRGIATGNQKEMISQIEALNIEKNNLQNKVNSLLQENNRLKSENQQLKNH